ncbi:MAG: TrkA family potassium uptake protein [Firmicutes bacterium]|nr:TrkA family potassium uptake protein [Bacillota bacterium]
MQSYLVIGLGRFGTQIALELSRLGMEVLAIDTNAELVQRVADEVTQAVVADGQDIGVLRALGAKNTDCGIVAIGDDLSASVLVTMNLKELGVPTVVCKARDETHRRVLEKLGADKVVIPEKEYAARLARSLASYNVLDYFQLGEGVGILELPVPGVWQGKTLKQVDVRAKYHVNIIAIRAGGKLNTFPSPDYPFEKSDVLVMIGDSDAFAAVQRL